jgi:hypothetical protein
MSGDRKTNSTTNKIDRKIRKEWKGHADGMSNDSTQKLSIARKRKFGTTRKTVK